MFTAQLLASAAEHSEDLTAYYTGGGALAALLLALFFVTRLNRNR